MMEWGTQITVLKTLEEGACSGQLDIRKSDGGGSREEEAGVMWA